MRALYYRHPELVSGSMARGRIITPSMLKQVQHDALREEPSAKISAMRRSAKETASTAKKR
jgi:hypothetical protein